MRRLLFAFVAALVLVVGAYALNARRQPSQSPAAPQLPKDFRLR